MSKKANSFVKQHSTLRTANNMKYWSAVLFILCFIQASIATQFVLNPEANCSPPQGCDFLSPSTWLNNGSIPTSGNNDTIYISAASYNTTLIVANALEGAELNFRLQSLSVYNATFVFDWCLVYLSEGITLSNSRLIIRNETEVESDSINFVLDPSEISMHDSSLLYIDSEFLLPSESIIYAYDDSYLAYFQSSNIYGDVYAFNRSRIDLGPQVNVYGNVESDASSWIEGYNLTFHGTHQTSTLSARAVNVLDTLQITLLAKVSNLTLGESAEFGVGGQYITNISTIGHVFSTLNSILQINSSNAAIGPSNLTQVSLQLNGNANVYANQTIFGQVIGSILSTLYITGGPSNLTKDITFSGNIIVQESSSFAIGHNITLESDDCISNYGQLDVYGTLNCFAAPFFANSSSSFTNLYGGTIKADVLVNDGATLALLGNAVLDGEVSLLLATLKVNPNFTTSISEVLELLNSTIDVDVNKDIHHTNESFMIQANAASLVGVILTTTTPAESRPNGTQTYNLLSSQNNITGKPIVNTELEHGSLEFEFPSPKEIIFKYTPIPTPNKPNKEILPLWAWILIGVGGFLVLVLLVALIVKSCKSGKKAQYKAILD